MKGTLIATGSAALAGALLIVDDIGSYIFGGLLGAGVVGAVAAASRIKQKTGVR